MDSAPTPSASSWPGTPAGSVPIGAGADGARPGGGGRSAPGDVLATSPLSIDLHGYLAGILSLETKAKRPLNESGPEIGYMKLVAGARNHHNCLLVAQCTPHRWRGYRDRARRLEIRSKQLWIYSDLSRPIGCIPISPLLHD
jgi:hypothetical protein